MGEEEQEEGKRSGEERALDACNGEEGILAVNDGEEGALCECNGEKRAPREGVGRDGESLELSMASIFKRTNIYPSILESKN